MGRDVADSSIGLRTAFIGFPLFLVIGATAALYGPTIPAFRSAFHITAAAAGLLLGGHFAGSIVGTVAPSMLPRRVRAPRVLTAGATLCFALGCLTIAGAPAWPVPVVGAVIEGMGWGGLVIVFNALFASGFGHRSPTMLTLLNAIFGLGAILGPAGVGLLAASGFRIPFLLVATAALALIPVGLTLPGEEPGSTPPEHARAPGWDIRGPLALFLVAFFLYGGLEAGIGAWEPTHLVGTGRSVAAAATITSFFWTSFTLGRLAVAPLALLVKPEGLVLGCLAIVAALTLSAHMDAVTAAAYTASGVFLGPIFPLAVVWAGRVMGASQRVTAFVISGDLLGGTVLPALLGALVTGAGVQALPIAFAVFATGSLGMLLAIQLRGKGVIVLPTAR